MNYVILNGTKSTMIKGLLIQSLPPVSKPLMRTQVEEIDGRDGDIITPLGYQAYDRTLTIGLHGDFDIDEVIQFFATQGTVIFSNEPDKYYYYQMLAKIDFERLIRFRQATVALHCQPFKYSAVEDVLSFTSFTNNSITVTNSGNTEAKPTVTIYGSGTINLSVNGYMILVLDLSSDNHITINASAMEAYMDTPDTLKNRLVTGDYSNLVLRSGANTISWTGTVTRVDVEDYSRWI